VLSDKDLSDFVDSLDDDLDIDLSTMPSAEHEGIVRAYVNIAAHLIHRPAFAERKELPAAIGGPLWRFSKIVGRPPSLTYASYVLANFTSPISARTAAGDLHIAQTPTGTDDEAWFVAVHLSVESTGGAIVDAAYAIERCLDSKDESTLISALRDVESSLIFAADAMPTVRERLDADVFVKDIRPLLYGHDEICFRGVPGDPVVTYIGETGAQSGAIRAADAVLGTPHSEATTVPMNRFLECAPLNHRRFCQRATAIGNRLATEIDAPQVRNARHTALLALTEFRRTHYKVVSDYLTPKGHAVTSHGTGGTRFKVWLQEIVEETERAARIDL